MTSSTTTEAAVSLRPAVPLRRRKRAMPAVERMIDWVRNIPVFEKVVSWKLRQAEQRCRGKNGKLSGAVQEGWEGKEM